MISTDRLSLGRLAAFSFPVVLFQAIELGWRTYLPAFLTQSIGLSLTTVGILMMAARSFDAAAGPVIGWLSDHFPTRFGRRRPWMAAGAPLASIGALALFLAPPGSSIASVIAACLALHLGYSLIVTPHGGWGLELSSDMHERTRIMGAKVWFGAAGSIGTLLLLTVLERFFGVGLAGLVMALGLIIALLAPVSVGLVVSLFAEKSAAKDDRPGHPLTLLRDMGRDPALRRVILLYLLAGVADASSMGSFLFLCENVLGLKGWAAGLMLLQPIQLLLTLPIWSAVSRRLGRERTLAIAYAWQALVMMLVLLLPLGGLAFFAGFLLLRNLSYGVDYMLLRAMVADFVGYGVEQGQRRAGSYYALTSIALSLAMGAGAAGMLWLVGLAGFRVEAIASGAAQLVVRLAYAMPTAAYGLIGLFVLRRSLAGTVIGRRWSGRKLQI